jgi:hypothetical protein
MRVPNDLKFDTETYLLFSIYYEAYGILKGMDGSAATYVKRFEKQIRGMGQVLEWLALAIRDKNSPLGWKPSHDLISLIAKPHKPSKSKRMYPSAEDDEVFDMILDAAVGELDENSNIPSCVASLLTALGLMVRSGDDLGGYIPTKRLRKLACERHQKERYQRNEERWLKSA